MVYEWIRKLPEFPTVYIQALSGGTGPLGIIKGCKELINLKLIEKVPRFILTQSNKCSPMADAWQEAKNKNFPEGWEKKYPIYKSPKTEIPTLATGNPSAYPRLAKTIKKHGGEIISFDEQFNVDVARLVAFEASIRMGPAAAVAVGGFFNALKQNLIKNKDVIVLCIGEGIRRSPKFMEKLDYFTSEVNNVNECSLIDREEIKKELWNNIKRI